MQAGTTPKKRTSLNGRADQAASDARVTKASSSRAAVIANQADTAAAVEAVEVVAAALDHSSHRDWAGGLVQELQNTVDELAGTSGRPSRSNGVQHHAVQAAQEYANYASVLLEQTKQFADDIRSQPR